MVSFIKKNYLFGLVLEWERKINNVVDVFNKNTVLGNVVFQRLKS